MIADIQQDVLPFLGLGDGATDEEIGVLKVLLPAVERAIKDFVGTEIEQATYTHYLPMRERRAPGAAAHTWFEKQGDKAVEMTSAPTLAADRLILPEVPVTAISAVYEDYDAYGDQQSGDFPASTLLTAGTDYWLLQFADGMCKTGILMRRGSLWPSRPGTVKVQYTAGWTAAQLKLGSSPGVASAITLAVLVALRQEFSSWGEGGGPVKSERLGEYAVTYARQDMQTRLPKQSRSLLAPFIHLGRKL